MEFTFDDASYSKFLNKNKTETDSRLRGENETFFDAILSKEADLRTTHEGKKIIQYIQSIESKDIKASSLILLN